MSMDKASWERYVAEGRKLAEAGRDNNWAIADLALKVYPTQRQGGRPGRRKGDELMLVVLERLINEASLDVAPNTLRNWRRAAAAWPPERRVQGCSINLHVLLARHPKRFKLLKRGMTPKEARLLTGVAAHGSGKSFRDTLNYLDASAGFIRTATGSLSKRPLTGERAELIGERVAHLEGALAEFLELTDMNDEGPDLRLVA
jgi:hypothetical protein